MAEPDLQFIGEQLRRMQAELRELRSSKADKADVEALRMEFQAFRAEMAAGFAIVHDRIDRVEQRMNAEFAAIQAQFEQVHRTMATNFAIIIETLKTRRDEF